MWYTGIFAIPTLLLSLPRTLNFSLSWMSVLAVISILISCVVAMAGAGKNPTPGRSVQVSVSSNFYTAFISITSPVFAYAVSFFFFFIILSCVVTNCCSGPLYVFPAGVGNEAVRYALPQFPRLSRRSLMSHNTDLKMPGRQHGLLGRSPPCSTSFSLSSCMCTSATKWLALPSPVCP